jgi:hypothetical protein
MSGAGKSTLLDEMSRRGYPVIDTDYDGWTLPDGTWDEPRMAALLAERAGRPGRPLTSSQLLRRMTALGIQARPARNTTLMAPAAQLPAVVLARLLGLAVPTATRWTGAAGAQQAAHAADLARRTNKRG